MAFLLDGSTNIRRKRCPFKFQLCTLKFKRLQEQPTARSFGSSTMGKRSYFEAALQAITQIVSPTIFYLVKMLVRPKVILTRI
ncbi:hypothetical protein DZC73_02825 [Albitalea terrae]|uniref:Uncharacterized protein n=1 Tax=Piscinibacter terrae TaxID=2496871 RepID=A0A3N7HUR1_9BURK|nr:hypothetical protein DZC73_02825 [Albitalea terrae]